MTGRELAALLQRDGFAVVRRSQSYLWLARGEGAKLMLDLDAEIDATTAKKIIERALEHE